MNNLLEVCEGRVSVSAAMSGGELSCMRYVAEKEQLWIANNSEKERTLVVFHVYSAKFQDPLELPTHAQEQAQTQEQAQAQAQAQAEGQAQARREKEAEDQKQEQSASEDPESEHEQTQSKEHAPTEVVKEVHRQEKSTEQPTRAYPVHDNPLEQDDEQEQLNLGQTEASQDLRAREKEIEQVTEPPTTEHARLLQEFSSDEEEEDEEYLGSRHEVAFPSLELAVIEGGDVEWCGVGGERGRWAGLEVARRRAALQPIESAGAGLLRQGHPALIAHYARVQQLDIVLTERYVDLSHFLSSPRAMQALLQGLC